MITVRLMGVLLLPSSALHTSVASARGRSSSLVLAPWWAGPPGQRPSRRMSSTGRRGFHGIDRQERCHLAASAPILEHACGRGVGGAHGGERGCADVHRMAGCARGDEAAEKPAQGARAGEMCDPEHHASIYTDGGEAVTKAVRAPVRPLVRPATRGRRVVSKASVGDSSDRRKAA
jgi:hypothetical protein